MSKTQPAPADDLLVDDVAERLKRLGAELVEHAEDKQERVKRLDDVVALVRGLSDEERKALGRFGAFRELLDLALDEERPTPAGDMPGEVRGFQKKSWTWRDLEAMPKKTFTPFANQTLIWNGLRVDVRAHKPVTLPEVFYGMWQDSLNNIERAEEHARWLFRHGDELSDPSIVTAEGAMARGTGSHGWYQPGAGVVAGAVGGHSEGGEGGE